jgi:hypothetical protein
LAFATPLKEAVSYAFHVPIEDLGSGTEKDQEFAFPLIVTEFHLSDFLEHLHDNCYEIPEDVKTSIIESNQGTSFMSYREILQIFGTEICRRQIDDRIWITIMDDRVRGCGSHRVILSDVRFKDEKDYVKSIGGRSVLITRPSLKQNDTHESENNLNGEEYDVLISNDSTIAGLYYDIDLWTGLFVDRMMKG